MIIAFLVSLLVVGLIALLIIRGFEYELEASGIKIVCIVSIGIVMSITLLTGGIETESYRNEISVYKTTKHTYEMALQDEDLTGLERLNIVQSIVEKNEWLTSSQHYASQWYGFHLPREILELETIEIKKRLGE